MVEAALKRVVVVGGSLSGIRTAENLRRQGFDRQLTVVGAERHLPYQRPPLSKQFLAGSWDESALALRVDYSLDIQMRLGTSATELDLGRRHVLMSDGEVMPYDVLVVATGAEPRTLAHATEMTGVYTLRTIEDCVAIRGDLARCPRVAVVGAGFIGSEVAATCRRLGLEVTLIEPLGLPMVRAVGIEIGQLCAQMHADHGVHLRLGTGVSALEGSDRVQGVRLSDGSRVDADVVVLGIGVRPSTDWLTDSGLHLDDGVVCDETGAAAGRDDVFAVGDVARFWHADHQRYVRLEHWDNAIEQARVVAANIVAGRQGARPYAPVGSFWSDQFDTKLQLVGIPQSGDEVVIVDGKRTDRRFVAAYGHGGITSAILAWNQPHLVAKFRSAVTDRMPFPPY
ncbi:MAG TPA: FAD-dependent oxidoreductase [Streptosporangiaceae bacterium]|jgi:NADPH-dependent 2,4-dienoyl-CoA reductase/sulfur reductase-like enzyme